MKTSRFYILFAILLFEIACEGPAGLRLPEHEPKLVVHAHWEAYRYMWIHVSRSYAMGELINPNELLIPDANVEVWENGIKLPDFVYHDTSRVEIPNYSYQDTSIVLYGQYMHPDFALVKPNGHYQLKISHPDYEDVMAEFQAPGHAEISNVSIQFLAVSEIDFTNARAAYHVIQVTVDDPPGEDNYYSLGLCRRYPFRPSGDALSLCDGDLNVLESYSANALVPAGTTIFNDEGRDGEQFTEKFYVRVIPYISNPDGSPREGYYRFTLNTMSKSMANYYESTEQQRRELNLDNLLFTPGSAPVKSNIEGGYGVFGFQKSTDYELEF